MKKKESLYESLYLNPEKLKKQIITELCRIAFADMGDYIRVDRDENGEPCIICSDPSECDTAAIGEMSQSKGVIKLKLLNKESALVRLGNYLGMWKDKPEEDIEDLEAIKEGLESDG